jgi:hypothetical protein
MALTGKLDADFSAFYDACTKAVLSLVGMNEAGKGTETAFNGLTESVSSSAAGMVAAVASGEVVADVLKKIGDMAMEAATALPELIAHTIEVGNQLYEMSLKTGASVENLSALRYVASQTGIEFSKFGTIFSKMEQNLGASGAAADHLQSKLNDLHLNLQTLKNEKPDQAFIDIMDALSQIPNRADQAAIGVAVFGKGFKDMAGLTQESISRMIADAKDLGVVMSTETAAAAHAAEIGFNGFRMQLEAVGAHIASAFLPAIIGVTADLRDLFKGALDSVNSSLAAMGGGGGFLATVAAAMGTGDKAIQAQTQLYEYFKEGLIGVVRYGVEPLVTAFAGMMQIWDEALILGKAVVLGYEGITYSIEGLLYYTNKLAQYTDPMNAAKYKADAATISIAMDELYDKMAANDGEIETLKKNQKDWADTGVATNAAIEKSLTALGQTHRDVGKTINEFADASKNAYGGVGKDVEGAATKVKGFDKTLADLTAKIDAANNANASYADKLKVFGAEAAKVALEAHTMGITVSASVQDVADAFAQAQLDKTIAGWMKGINNFEAVLKELPKVSLDSFKSLVAETDAYQKSVEALYQQSTTGADLQIHNINRAHDAAIKALNDETQERDALYTETRNNIDAFYQHQTDVANKTASTIEERMAAQGVYTQERLDEMAFNAAQDYNQMVADGGYTAQQLAAAAKKSQDAWDAADGEIKTSWHTALSDMLGGLDQLGQAIGGTFGKLTSAASSAFKSATAGVANLASGFASFASGDILGGISGVISGVGGIASAAITAGKAIGGLISNLFGLGSKGRDAVVQFADSFGGFDALHVKLNALGDSGEQLWIKLTQGVGKNDPAAAKAAIQAITDALAAQQNASQDTQVQTEAQAAATVETATEASNALDTVTEKLKANVDDWKTWGDAVNGVINAVGAAVIAMPTPSAPGTVPGFATGTKGEYLDFGSGTLAMLHGKERVMTPGESAGGGGGGGTAVIQIDGRTLAEIVVPEMPGVIRRYGLA